MVDFWVYYCCAPTFALTPLLPFTAGGSACPITRRYRLRCSILQLPPRTNIWYPHAGDFTVTADRLLPRAALWRTVTPTRSLGGAFFRLPAAPVVALHCCHCRTGGAGALPAVTHPACTLPVAVCLRCLPQLITCLVDYRAVLFPLPCTFTQTVPPAILLRALPHCRVLPLPAAAVVTTVTPEGTFCLPLNLPRFNTVPVFSCFTPINHIYACLPPRT